jgi:hypothetical protein
MPIVRDHASVRVFDSGHTTMATATAIPTQHTPQRALTRKMIAVAMQRPQFAVLAGVQRQKKPSTAE